MVARFEVGALPLELLVVGFGGAQRLAVRQKEVAGIAVLDANRVAHVSELADALQQDNIHCFVSYFCAVGFGVGKNAARARSPAKASMTPRAARTGRVYCARSRQQAESDASITG